VLTGIQIQGDPEEGKKEENVKTTDSPAILQYSGMAAFKKDKLVGWLNEKESKGCNYIRGNVSSTLVNVPCPKGGILGVEVIRMKESLKGKVEKGKPSIDVKIQVEANVADVECKIDLTKAKTIYELETKVEQVIKGDIEAVVKKAQKEYKSDILGFGEVIHRSDPKAWKKLENNWDKEFFDLPINVEVDVKIRRLGTVNESFLKELEE
jgi:spore germination protein KC